MSSVGPWVAPQLSSSRDLARLEGINDHAGPGDPRSHDTRAHHFGMLPRVLGRFTSERSGVIIEVRQIPKSVGCDPWHLSERPIMPIDRSLDGTWVGEYFQHDRPHAITAELVQSGEVLTGSMSDGEPDQEM